MFNVGDKVRIVENVCGHEFSIGGEVTLVEEIKTSRPYWLAKSGNSGWYINETEFESIGKTLQELGVKPGDIVRGVDCTFANEKDFICVDIVAEGRFAGDHTMKSKGYGQGIFGNEDGKWIIVSRASDDITSPTPPRKMHPDDFIQSVNDFALDNGFSVDTMAIKTHGGATVYYTNPQPAN